MPFTLSLSRPGLGGQPCCKGGQSLLKGERQSWKVPSHCGEDKWGDVWKALARKSTAATVSSRTSLDIFKILKCNSYTVNMKTATFEMQTESFITLFHKTHNNVYLKWIQTEGEVGGGRETLDYWFI